MTAIAGIVHKGEVWIGADALMADSGFNCTVAADPKVFRVGPLLVGVAGSRRVSQLVQYKLTIADDPRAEDAQRFIAVEFVDRLRKVLSDNGAAIADSQLAELSACRSSMLVGFRGRLFVVHPDFQVCEPAQGYEAMGSGGNYALGSLFETAGPHGRKMDPRSRLRRALQCAEKFSAGVRGPFTILRLPAVADASKN